MTFGEWVAKNPTVDRTILARRALRECKESVIEVIAHEIDHVRRGDTRTRESLLVREFFRSIGHAAGEATALPTTSEGFAALLKERFALGDGVRVTWGAATVEQHEQRIAMLKAMITGFAETVRRHELAIEQLRATGTKCLNELTGEAAA